jgi:hypothetical protein
MLVTILAPKPCVHDTLTPPIKEQTPMYGIILVFPQRGATKNTTPRLMAMQSDPHTRKPGDRKSFLKAAIVVTLCCSGALRARIVAPMIHNVQPIHP